MFGLQSPSISFILILLLQHMGANAYVFGENGFSAIYAALLLEKLEFFVLHFCVRVATSLLGISTRCDEMPTHFHFNERVQKNKRKNTRQRCARFDGQRVSGSEFTQFRFHFFI